MSCVVREPSGRAPLQRERQRGGVVDAPQLQWTKGRTCLLGDAVHPMMPNLGQGGCQSTEDGYRLAEELGSVLHTREVPGALSKYSRVRVIRTAIVQGFAQLGSDLLVDFDLMMTIPILGPFFLTATQLSMPWILRFLYTPEF